MTRALIVLLVALAASPLCAQDAAQKFGERVDEVNQDVADAHVELAQFCFKTGWNAAGHMEIEQALELIPEHEKAMKALGFRRKRVDGEETWVRHERRAPPETDHPDADPRAFARYEERRDKARVNAAAQYVSLAEYALELGLEAHARAVWLIALRYDPDNEDALKGAGWVKVDGEWISPDEHAEREATRKALDAADAEEVGDLPGWASRVYGAQEVKGRRVGQATAMGVGGALDDLAKYAHAAQAILAGLLGGEPGALRVILTSDEDEHAGYVSARHPGIPGLARDEWIIGRNEVAVRKSDDEALTIERTVYAVSILEVRRRAGETRHPWFEIGMATNLTRRLCGSVATAQLAGEAEHPPDLEKWQSRLKAMSKEEQPRLGELVVDRNPDEDGVMLAHFVVRYLARRRAAALPAYCAAYKVDRLVEESFRSAFGQGVDEIEEEFRLWFEVH